MAKTWSYTHTYASNQYNIGYFQTETEAIEVFAEAATFRVKTPNIRAAATIVAPGFSWGTSRIVRPAIRASWDISNHWTSVPVPDSVGMGSYCEWVQYTHSKTFNTADYFNSNNPTVRSLSFGSWEGAQVDVRYNGSGSSSDYYIAVFDDNYANRFTFAPITLTLNVPPTFNTTTLSIDTTSAYTDITTASVTVSDTTAYYGGSISSVEFTIGNQTATTAGDGTLSILLNTGGTFTPTVTVTDSRGQTNTLSLDPLTVNVYTAPTVSFDVERTDSTGTPDDEGTYGLIEATLTFADVIATAIAPSVVLTDENGTQTTPTVTWYTDDTLTTTVTWSNVSSGDTVYGLFSGVNTQYSYSVSVRPRDSEGTGTAITQTLGSAFYTVDFLAGGHGIAFGKPASNVGFECAMDATFEADCVAKDMTQQEIQDFIDSIGGGGDPVADVVVEQGADGIWTYRKWSSGIAECWARKSESVSCIVISSPWIRGTMSATNFPSGLFISTPTVLASGFGAEWVSLGTTTSTSISYIYIYTVVTGTATRYVWLYAIGKWK